MKILTNYDFNKNQLMNATVHKLSGPPAIPVSGQIYYNTTENRLYVYNSSEWIGADAIGATMTGDSIVDAVNGSSKLIDNDNLSMGVNEAITKTAKITIVNSIDLDSIATSVSANNSKISNATHTGDVTGSTALTIANKAVTNAKSADMAAKTIKGRKEATAGVSQDLTVAEVRTLLNVEDGAQVNTITSVAGKTGAVNLTKVDVGLSNVTDDAQVKKATSSTSDSLVVWDGTNGDKIKNGYTVQTSLSSSSTAIPRADAVKKLC